MAIVDEIAAKETLQVQQKQTLQQVNEVSKDSSFSPASRAQRHASRQGVRQNSLSLSQAMAYTCFLCRSGGHVRPKFKFRKAIFRSCNVRKGTHCSRLQEETSERFDFRGRVAGRIFELYTAVWDN